MVNVQLKNISRKFNDFKLLDNFNLEVKNGEFLVLVGPSGSGKSTILRIIAGLEKLDAGEILIDNNIINKFHPKDRDVAMVFQNYALYPHMTVYDNLAFPLKVKKMSKDIIDNAVKETANILNISQHLYKKPKDMSGGERQRVALGRAIIRKPKLFLMDEPLSNLDAKLRTQMRTELRRLHKNLLATIIYVTHDQIEALTMGSRIVVLDNGKVQQCGSPSEIYNNPQNLFVASFIGSPGMNFFNIKFQDPASVLFCNQEIKINLKKEYFDKLKTNNMLNKELILGIRSENLFIGSKENNLTFSAIVDLIEVHGNEHLVYFSNKNTKSNSQFSVKVSSLFNLNLKDELKISIDLNNSLYFDKESGRRINL